MRNKRLIGIALLAISGLAMLAVSSATAAPKKGGTYVVEFTSDVDYVDPQLSYYGETWKLEAATACKLFNWPDKEGNAGAVATPEVAAGLPVISKDGKTYTFTIRTGFKFSNGKPVNAKSFVDAINRFANPKMQSTGVAFLDIVKGAQAVVDGKATTVSGVKASGNKLVVQLTKAAPDFLARTTMPFFQAIDPDPRRSDRRERRQRIRLVWSVLLLSADAEPLDHPQEEPELRGWPRGQCRHDPGQHRQRHAVEFQNVENGTTDYASGGIPPAEWRNVVNKYGLNKKDGRVQVRALLDIRYLAMHHGRDAVQEQSRTCRRPSTGPSTVRRSPLRVGTCTASARARSCRRGFSATSRRASTRFASRPTRSRPPRSWLRATSAAARQSSGPSTAVSHRSRRSSSSTT